MKITVGLAMLLMVLPSLVTAQGLREVPQRFAYLQPIGLALGVANGGIEFAVGRRTSVEIGGVGVYSVEDGIRIYGGGPGIGIRRYFGEAELAGFVVGIRTDATWLTADNSDADRRFLTTGGFDDRQSDFFVGFGGMLGYRWVFNNGFFMEPTAGYEFFAGPRPLVPGSRSLQEHLGPTAGIAFGFAL